MGRTVSRFIPPDQRRRCTADIANDAGEDLRDGNSMNSGLNESDYLAFLNGFFEGLPIADIAYDHARTFDELTPPPFPVVVNNGVTEADYNVFFTQFFLPCP